MYILPILIIFFSGFLGIYLDVCRKIEKPVIFWILGIFPGLIAGIIIGRIAS